MILKRHFLEIFDDSHKNFKDRRKKEVYAVFSYFDDNGIEYRKAFCAPIGTPENEMWNLAPKIIEQ